MRIDLQDQFASSIHCGVCNEFSQKGSPGQVMARYRCTNRRPAIINRCACPWRPRTQHSHLARGPDHDHAVGSNPSRLATVASNF